MNERISDEEGGAAPGDAPADASSGWRERLRAALLDERPDDILLIGPRAADLFAAERDDVSSGAARWHRVDSLADCLQASPEARRADVALFAPAALERLERALGTACRLFPNRLLLLVEAPGMPAPERLFAFGFRRVFAASGPAHGSADDDPESARGDAPAAALYEYRLRDYKQPPAWLNARFWANPARFDLDEEPSEYEDDTDEFEADELEPDDTGKPDGVGGRHPGSAGA